MREIAGAIVVLAGSLFGVAGTMAYAWAHAVGRLPGAEAAYAWLAGVILILAGFAFMVSAAAERRRARRDTPSDAFTAGREPPT